MVGERGLSENTDGLLDKGRFVNGCQGATLDIVVFEGS
jgi:hypothetical protein